MLVTNELTGDLDVEEETTGVELLYGVSAEELTGDSEVEERITMLELPYGTSLEEELLYGVLVEELTGDSEVEEETTMLELVLVEELTEAEEPTGALVVELLTRMLLLGEGVGVLDETEELGAGQLYATFFALQMLAFDMTCTISVLT